MPIYEYQCQSCAHRLEALQKVSDAALTECPECHKDALKKLVSAASFRLKGGGWYETDFKTGNKKQLAESDNKSADGSASKSKEGDTGKAKSESAGASKSSGSGKSGSGKAD